MKKLYVSVCLCLALLTFHASHACAQEEGANDPQQEQSQAVTISNDDLSELIETLESPTSREEFIQNLKTLKEANKENGQDDQDSAAFTKVLGLNNQIGNLARKYKAFLAENDLNSSTIGKTALTIGSAFIFLILGLLVKKSGITFRNNLLRTL